MTLGVAKQSFFGLPGQYGSRVTRTNGDTNLHSASDGRNKLYNKNCQGNNEHEIMSMGWRSGESTRFPPMWPGFDSQTRRNKWV